MTQSLAVQNIERLAFACAKVRHQQKALEEALDWAMPGLIFALLLGVPGAITGMTVLMLFGLVGAAHAIIVLLAMFPLAKASGDAVKELKRIIEMTQNLLPT